MAGSPADPTAVTRQARYSRVLRWSDSSQPKYFCPLVRPDGLLWQEFKLRGCVLHHVIRTAARPAPGLLFKEQAGPASTLRPRTTLARKPNTINGYCSRITTSAVCLPSVVAKDSKPQFAEEADRARSQTRSKDRKTRPTAFGKEGITNCVR